MEIRNNGEAPVKFTFPTSQRYDVAIWNGGCADVWRWSAGKMFAQSIQTTTVAAHGNAIYHISWQQRDQGGRPAQAGAYEAQVIFLGRGPQGKLPVALPPLMFTVK